MNERGTTLIEMLVVMVMLPVVFGGSYTMLTGSEHTAPRENEQALAIKSAQQQMERMTRELRQAYRMLGSGYNYVDFEITLAGSERRVRYDCTQTGSVSGTRACVRREGPAGGALGTPVVVIDRVLNGQDTLAGRVFAPDDPISPKHIDVRLELPAAGERTATGYSHSFTLDDGVFLRNLALT